MFGEDGAEQNEDNKAKGRDEPSAVVERVDDDEHDEGDDDDGVRDQREESELRHPIDQVLDGRPDGFGDLVSGLGVAQETFDAVAVKDAPEDSDGHQDEKAKAVAPLEVLVTLEAKSRAYRHHLELSGIVGMRPYL